MTDNEIIKALGYCSNVEGPCKDCFFKYEKEYCVLTMTGYALDLIKRQQVENVDLNTYIKQLDIEHRYELKHVVNDTIETFAEKLKELYETEGIITDDMKVPIGVIRANIDDIVEEMVGANNDR